MLNDVYSSCIRCRCVSNICLVSEDEFTETLTFNWADSDKTNFIIVHKNTDWFDSIKNNKTTSNFKLRSGVDNKEINIYKYEENKSTKYVYRLDDFYIELVWCDIQVSDEYIKLILTSIERRR